MYEWRGPTLIHTYKEYKQNVTALVCQLLALFRCLF